MINPFKIKIKDFYKDDFSNPLLIKIKNFSGDDNIPPFKIIVGDFPLAIKAQVYSLLFKTKTAIKTILDIKAKFRNILFTGVKAVVKECKIIFRIKPEIKVKSSFTVKPRFVIKNSILINTLSKINIKETLKIKSKVTEKFSMMKINVNAPIVSLTRLYQIDDNTLSQLDNMTIQEVSYTILS